MPPDPLTLVVFLHVDPGHEEEEGAGRPNEVHVVTFPSEERLHACTSDPELGSLADLRARAVRHTEIWHGRDIPPPVPSEERT